MIKIDFLKPIVLTMAVILTSTHGSLAEEPDADPGLRQELHANLLRQAESRGLPGDGRLLVVSVPEQRMWLVSSDGVARSYVISTSSKGVGQRQHSERTPLGWHRVTDWIGRRARPGQVFVGRVPTKEVIPYTDWRSDGRNDYVLTRIMWLDGLEPGVNRGSGIDTRSRFIYFHGTNQEHLLGSPSSQGCIRLSNRDVMELFDLTSNHVTYCWISDQKLVGRNAL